MLERVIYILLFRLCVRWRIYICYRVLHTRITNIFSPSFIETNTRNSVFLRVVNNERIIHVAANYETETTNQQREM